MIINQNTMQRFVFIVTIALFAACTGNSQNRVEKEKIAKDTAKVIQRTDAEWRSILTSEQYHVLREKGTDAPYMGKYYLNHEKGVYTCAGCGAELFTSDMKFDSECGWPSFDKELAGDKILKIEDTSHGMIRTEIVCARCGAHLGHLFDDGPTLTGKRYCVNSTSLNFESTKKKK